MKDKYFIKCSLCGHLVEVKSEYMVLCPACGKRMGNSFPRWLEVTGNGDKTFVDYCREVCVSGTAAEGLVEQRKIGRMILRGRVLKRFGVASAVALGLFLSVAGGMWIWARGGDESIKEVMEEGWRMSYYDDLGATVSFPFSLEAAVDTVFVEPDSVTQVNAVVARQWRREGVCSVTAMRLGYVIGTSTDREAASTQILQSLVADNGMQAFQFIPSDYTLSDAKARMLSGSYLIAAQMYEFRAVMINRAETVWFFMCAYPAEKTDGVVLADKFFKTIRIHD